MTDRQTDRHRAMASTVLAQCRADKMVAVTGPVHGRLNAALHRPTFTISVHVDIASIPSKAVDGNNDNARYVTLLFTLLLILAS